jgi:hypothetical protein
MFQVPLFAFTGSAFLFFPAAGYRFPVPPLLLRVPGSVFLPPRYRHGAFLSTSLPSFLQCTAAIVRQMPALSAGGKSACGQENPQNSGMSVSASIWYHFLCENYLRRIRRKFVKKDDANASSGAAWSSPAGSIVTRRPWQTGETMRYIEIAGR